MIPSAKTLSFCVVFAVAAVFTAAADDRQTGLLDGMRFAGTTGETGRDDAREDVVTFESGTMQSIDAGQRGFEPGPYRAKQLDGVIHFGAALKNPQGAVLEFKGTVEGDLIEARYRFKHETWTWLVDRTFLFRGSLSEADP